MQVRPYQSGDEEAVIALWQRCELVRPQNDPRKDIARKQRVQPELFLVAMDEQQQIIGSVMCGYEGHRGWINYLAVDLAHRRCGLGRALMAEAERVLRAAGCPKINLQVRSSNAAVIAFYVAIGFAQDDVVSMGKRLERDETVQ
ncbi:MAG TPA: GNAT family acetyltransferase [Tepidisphaeraceae bacterium]|nr:GNAT family acetyltransferase [Tepidisphaeraceae bacterium]